MYLFLVVMGIVVVALLGVHVLVLGGTRFGTDRYTYFGIPWCTHLVLMGVLISMVL